MDLNSNENLKMIKMSYSIFLIVQILMKRIVSEEKDIGLIMINQYKLIKKYYTLVGMIYYKLIIK